MAKAWNVEIDFNSDVIKLMLCTSSYTPDLDAHVYKSSVTNEVSGTGYTATGAVLGSATVADFSGNTYTTTRAATTAYTVGQIVRPATGNGYLYQCSAAGTTASGLPTYPTVVGQTVADGTVTWTCVGRGIMVLSGSNVSWTTATITARYAVLYDSTPASDATRPLIALIDFGADQTSTAGTFLVQWDPSGIAYVLIA
jgi:hypothetical protein